VNSPAIAVTLVFEHLRVTIDGILHLSLDTRELVAIQSWKYTHAYRIEYTTKTTAILCEYDRREIWESILAGLAAINLI
jgi:hypothetical protein